jgi:hypothetical protein
MEMYAMSNLSNIEGMVINKNTPNSGKIIYCYENQNQGYDVMGIDGDTQLSDNDEGIWWKLEPIDGQVDTYYLVCPAYDLAIYCFDQEDATLAVGARSPDFCYLKVVPINEHSGTYQLISVNTGKAIFCNPLSGRLSVSTPDQSNKDQWWMIIPKLDWSVDVENIDYDKNIVDNLVGTPDLWFSEDVPNNSAATATTHFNKAKIKSSTFEFSFTETLSASVTASFTAGIPLIASTDMSITIEMGLSANQRWEKTVTEEYGISHDIEYPPYSKTRVQCITEFPEDVTIPFTMEVRVTANHKDGTPLENNELETYLSATGFNGTIINSGINELWVRIKGKLFGSWGIHSQLILTPLEYDS